MAEATKEQLKAQTITALQEMLVKAESGELVCIEISRPAIEDMPSELARSFKPGPDLYVHFRIQ